MKSNAIIVWRRGTLVVLDRDWASYERGTRFVVAYEVKCGDIQQADGTFVNPTNLRVVLEGDDVTNALAHRTIPAEYAVPVPFVGQFMRVEANQGLRDGEVLAVDGSDVLLSYDMPAGRTFGRVINLTKPGWYRAVCLTNLPKRWRDVIDLMDQDAVIKEAVDACNEARRS